MLLSAASWELFLDAKRFYTIHKLVLTIDEQLRIPALGFVPARPAGPATLYLHGVGMAEDAGPGGPIETP